MAVVKSNKTLVPFLSAAAALVVLIVYLPALGNGFINWDDPLYVYENLHIRSLDIRWLFTGVVAANWHPLTMLSFTMDYAFWGLTPRGYHLTNIIFHALNTALVFIVTVRLIGAAQKNTDKGITGKVIAGASAALLFGLHPIHVESVAWVSERKDVLSAFFYLLSILLYLKYARGGASKTAFYYLFSLFLFALALMSKPMAVSLPLVLLIVDFYPLDRLKNIRRVILEKIPFFVLTILSATITIWAQNKGEAIESTNIHNLTHRIVLPARAYIFYLYKMIIPVHLSPVYPPAANPGLFNPLTIISVVLLAAITFFCIIKFKKRVLLAVWLYYLVTLLPVIGIIKVGPLEVADRYTYLPGIGPFILTGLGVAFLLKKAGGRALKASVIVTAAFILVLFAFMTVARTRIWRDPITFWSEIIRVYPERVFVAYNQRGIAYAMARKPELALKDLNTAMELFPNDRRLLFNRAKVLGALGKYEEAIRDLSMIAALDPRAVYERGRLYEKTGRYEAALRDFKKTVALRPGFAEGYMDIARVYSRLGDAESAARYRKKAKAVSLKRGP